MIDRVGAPIQSPLPEQSAAKSQPQRESRPTASAKEILSRLLEVQVDGTQRHTVQRDDMQKNTDEFAPHLGRFLDVMA